jgi:hypothetical protein
MVKKKRYLNYIVQQYHTEPNIKIWYEDLETGEMTDKTEIKCGRAMIDADISGNDNRRWDKDGDFVSHEQAVTELSRVQELGKTKAPIGCIAVNVVEAKSYQSMLDNEQLFKIMWHDKRCVTNGLTEYYREDAQTAMDALMLPSRGNKDVTTEFIDGSVVIDAGAKKVRTDKKVNEQLKLEMEERYKDTGLFTNPQAACIAYNFNNVDHKNFDASIEKPFDKMNDISFFNQKNGSKIVFYHNGRLNDNEDFLEMIDVLGTEMDVEPVNNKKESYFKFDSEKEGLKMFGKLKSQGFKPMNT